MNIEYNREKRTVTCTEVINGKTYKGVAKCHPKDTFNERAGESIASARCYAKVCKAEYEAAKELLLDRQSALNRARVAEDQARKFCEDKREQYIRADTYSKLYRLF